MWSDFKTVSKGFLSHLVLPWFESPCTLAHRLKVEAESWVPRFMVFFLKPPNAKQISSILGDKKLLTTICLLSKLTWSHRHLPLGSLHRPVCHFVPERKAREPLLPLPARLHLPYSWSCSPHFPQGNTFCSLREEKQGALPQGFLQSPGHLLQAPLSRSDVTCPLKQACKKDALTPSSAFLHNPSGAGTGNDLCRAHSQPNHSHTHRCRESQLTGPGEGRNLPLFDSISLMDVLSCDGFLGGGWDDLGLERWVGFAEDIRMAGRWDKP